VIVLVGISHHTAPIDKREQLALSEEAAKLMLDQLLGGQDVGEALVLSTCNRVEVVAAPRQGVAFDGERLLDFTSSVLSARHPELTPYLYRRAGTEAVHHLFRVASSLDSLVLGEAQILGQLKSAFDTARDHGALGPKLTRTLTHAIRTAKRVRTTTQIGAGQVSVPSVAVELAAHIFGSLEGKVAALIGSGDMGESVAKLLRQEGTRTIVVGRNPERLAELARTMSAEARTLDQLEATLVDADVVVSTTAAPVPIISRELVARVMKKRRGRSIFLIDLAVPRDVEASADHLDNVYLYNVDDFSQVVQNSMSSRQKEAERAESIVLAEASIFDRTSSAEQVVPVIVSLRQRLRSVLDAELERSLNGKLKHLSDADRKSLSKMLDASLNKMLHVPSARLKEIAADPDERGDSLQVAMATLDDLFGLSGGAESEGSGVREAPQTQESGRSQSR